MKSCIKDRNRIKQPNLNPVTATVTPVLPVGEKEEAVGVE